MRQEGVLLRFVKAVHLVDKEDGVATARTMGLRLLDGLADLLDAAQHSRDGDHLGVEGGRGEAGQRGLAGAGWTPQDHRVGDALVECAPQRCARAQHCRLPDNVVERPRS